MHQALVAHYGYIVKVSALKTFHGDDKCCKIPQLISVFPQPWLHLGSWGPILCWGIGLLGGEGSITPSITVRNVPAQWSQESCLEGS